MAGRSAGCCAALIALLLPLGAQAQETPDCASTIRQFRSLLGDSAFSNRWTEVSMDDGKPLVVAIAERNGMLRLEVKNPFDPNTRLVSSCSCGV